MILVRPRTQNNGEGVVLSRFAVIADFDGCPILAREAKSRCSKKVTSTTDRPRSERLGAYRPDDPPLSPRGEERFRKPLIRTSLVLAGCGYGYDVV